MRFDLLTEEGQTERLAKLREGAKRAAARRRHQAWVAELEGYGFEVNAPEGYWGSVEHASGSEVTRIPA